MSKVYTSLDINSIEPSLLPIGNIINGRIHIK
jgi:hypothetical protein